MKGELEVVKRIDRLEQLYKQVSDLDLHDAKKEIECAINHLKWVLEDE
jgi:hypothetical protein